MEIEKAAVAGTLESSDCMVTVEDGDGNIDLVLESTVIHQYGNQIRHVVLDTLESLGVQSAKIKIVDKGALDCTIVQGWKLRYTVPPGSRSSCHGEVRSDERRKKTITSYHDVFKRTEAGTD